MKKLQVDERRFKALFSYIGRGGELKKGVAILFPEYSHGTICNNVYLKYREEYLKAKLKKKETLRRTRAARRREINRRYYIKKSSIDKKISRLHRYRSNPRFNEYERIMCKAYRVAKVIGSTTKDVMNSWYPNLPGPRWMGVDYSPYEATPDEIRQLAATELPVPPHTPLPHTKAH